MKKTVLTLIAGCISAFLLTGCNAEEPENIISYEISSSDTETLIDNIRN